MTKEEAYDFCYEHQYNENDYSIVINVFKNDDDNDHELTVVCNEIYHYMNREQFQELKEAMNYVYDDFDVTIKEYDD